MKIGISYVSIENARENLEREVGNKNFEEVYASTKGRSKNELQYQEDYTG